MGLRPRMLAALLLTSAVTLAVAALALLSPLEQRLRKDGESSVLAALNTSLPGFKKVAIDPDTGRLAEDELEDVVSSLRRRSQATVTILDSRLDVVYSGPSANLNVPDYYGQVRRALATHRRIQTLLGDELVVAYPLKISHIRYVLVVTKRLDYVSSAVHVVQNAFVEGAAAGLAIALLLGIGLTSRLLRRLEGLRDATRELERRGPDAAPIHTDERHDEIGELTRAFAGMQMRLSRQEAARRAFVATASHELRTPLASLDGLLELIEDDLGADPGQLDLQDARERTARAREQSRRLSQLASDLLDLSRLDAKVQLRNEPLELGELCRAVAAEFELSAAQSRVALAVEHSPQPCWVQADPGAVARIVRILLDNALRAAPPDSSVEVRIYTQGPSALVAVRDQGPGVAASESELIFERFQRGSATGKRSGFGLGLAIGRELATRMGGQLELIAGETPGARFELRLPVAVAVDESERAHA
jgi:signal transduction histidine kinase